VHERKLRRLPIRSWLLSELRDGNPGGYQFQLIGEPEDDLLALLGRLIDKIRPKALTEKLSKNKSAIFHW
jgi:hypothetical protein